MQTGSQHVLIEVAPSRIGVSVVRGRRILRSASRAPRSCTAEPGFNSFLSCLAAPFTELVAELECRSCAATVIYHFAGSAVLAASIPASLGPADAEEALALALAGVADFPIDGVPTRMEPLLVDAPVGNAKPSARQRHVLCAADRSDVIESLQQWVESAGLRFAGAIPVASVAMNGAARAAWASARRAGDRAAVLWVGEHGSALACVTEGSVRFVRPIGVGLESLVHALCQPIRGRDDTTPETVLDRDAAGSLLAAVGIPSPDANLPGLPGLTGAALLPVLQPALQRISIEAKQSLRFGIPEQERSNIRMSIAGPGSHLPGLGDWIARQCGLQNVGEPPTPLPDHEVLASALAHIAGSLHELPALMPEALTQSSIRRRSRAALAVGVAAAAAWIGAEWFTARTSLAEQSERLHTLQAAAGAGESVARLRDAAILASSSLAATHSRIAATLGQTTDVAGVLDAIALAAPEGVRLSTIEFTSDAERISAHISGFVRFSESDDPTKAIAKFVDALGATPVIQAARLAATQRTRIDGAQSQGFELTVELVPLPASLVSTTLAPSVGEMP